MEFSLNQIFTNNVEFFGFITGILSVLLLLPTKMPRLQYFAWPFGVLTSFTYFFLFRDWQLYGSTYLQVYFVLASLVGCYVWRGQILRREISNRENKVLSFFGGNVLPTTYVEITYFLRTLAFAALCLPFTYAILRHYNDSSPFWDGMIFVLSGAAIWLQVRKHVETWYLWIAVDCIAIPLYASQGNGGTAILYAAYMLMCFVGWKTWREEAKASKKLVGGLLERNFV